MENNGVKIKRYPKIETFVSAIFLIIFLIILWAEPLVSTINSENIENQNNYIETTDSNSSEEVRIQNDEVDVTKGIFRDFFQNIKGSVYFLLALLVVCCIILPISVKKNFSLKFSGESPTAFMFWCFGVPLTGLFAIIALMTLFNKDAINSLIGKCVIIGGLLIFLGINFFWWKTHFNDLKTNYSDSKVKFLNLCAQTVLIPLTFFWVVFNIESYKYLFATGIVGYMWIQYYIGNVDYYKQVNLESECNDRK